MNKIKSIIVLLTAVLSFSACSNNESQHQNSIVTEQIFSENSEVIPIEISSNGNSNVQNVVSRSATIIDYDLPELIGLSDYVVKAKCVGSEKNSDFTKTFFITEDVLSGGELGKFTVYQYPTSCVIEDTGITYLSGLNEFTPDDSYILILEERNSVFYDEPQYLLLGDFYAELDNEQITELTYYGIDKSDENFSDIAEAKTFVLTAKDENKNLHISKKNVFTHSDDVKEILNISKDVLVINILGIQDDGADRTVYKAEIAECLKGTSEGEIFAVLPKESAEIGKQYIAAFNRSSDTSLMYVIASPYGMFDISEKEMISEFCQ